ncbi:MAG: RNase P/RNase MRP subunit p30, partial [Planctomycetota bacterium]
MKRIHALLLAVLSLSVTACRSTVVDGRADILAAEMSRDASRLVEYLDPAAAEDLRLQAIVALGRIGDDG